MGVTIFISDDKFFNEFKNDIGFAANTSDFTTNLTGSVMENIKVSRFVDVSWNSEATLADEWTIDNVDDNITRTIGSFEEDGFIVGDTFDYIDNSGAPTLIFSGTITGLSALFLTFTISAGTAPSGDTTEDEIRGTTPLTALIYRFGLIENSESFNVISKVSGNDQGYYGSSIGFDTGGGVRDTNAVSLQVLGQFQDWVTGSMTSRFDSNPSTYVQRFEIIHELTIVPWYLDGEISNLQNNVIPDLLNGLNSLKYVFSSGFRNVLSNPNSEKQNQNDSALGSIAWFGESFNGFNNNYDVKSVAYEEVSTTNALTGISVSSATKITVTVERTTGSFSGAERFGAYISYLPEQDEYQNTVSTNVKDNFIYDRAINSAGLAGVTGDDFITDCLATVVSGELVIEVEVDYSTAQKQFLAGKVAANETNYVLAIQVGDNTLTSGNADRIMLIADAREYDEGADIPDLISFTKFDIYSHDEQIGVDTPSTDKTVWNEDGVAIDFSFDLDLNKDAVINTLDFKLVAYNSSTEESFDLDSFSYGVSQAVVSGGVQQLNENTTRGYILKTSDQFNEVTLSVGSLLSGVQTYNGVFAQKISWQDWIQNLDVDTIFFDNTELNDNLNNKASNYSLLNGYEIRLSASANVSGTSTLGVSGNTDYFFPSPLITTHDYEEDGNPTPIWSCVIETFNNSNASPIGTAVLTGIDTLFRATWTSINGPITDLTGFWGVNRIEENEQQGYDITEMSTLNDPDSNQLLIPSVGTLLDMTIVSGDVVMECLIDGSLAVSGIEYNLSSRIESPVEGKITEVGILKDTEVGITKNVE